MHALENSVIINNVSSDIKPVKLTSDYSSSATTELFVIVITSESVQLVNDLTVH